MNRINKKIRIYGIVQSVGFRPTVYSYAIKNNIVGYVRNMGSSVYIEAEGDPKDIQNFVNSITTNPPKKSQIINIETEDGEIKNYISFTIKESVSERGDIFISPDIAMCESCKKEFFDKENKRFEYAFINCTDCGPRFSIISNIPYDRKNTTMKEFQMCKNCEEEYLDPENRRYHAEPTCCPVCGPSLFFKDKENVYTENPIKLCCDYLECGKIVAVKGIGGYHIACNPYDDRVVFTLRERKHRYKKPLALMVANIDIAKKVAFVSQEEEALLLSKEAPIVLLDKRDKTFSNQIAPNTKKIGIMLPYAPIHYLLFKYLNIDALVMTSGNLSEEPIAYEDQDAFERLGGICDGFIYHNRKIENRIDDSVVTCVNNKIYPIRKARGYIPFVFNYNKNVSLEILATGSLLKNTFALAKNNNIYVSSHIGDLEEGIAFDYYLKQIDLYKRIFKINPSVVVCDSHPDYINTKWAKSLGISVLECQHHKAHAISSMAQNKLKKSICVTYDGTGYGDDGTIWGGEFFAGDINDLKRVAHLKSFRISGVNTFLSERIGPLKCLASFIEEKDFIWEKYIDEFKLLKSLSEKNINTFTTTSMGRFFDAVSALIIMSLNSDIDILNSAYEGEGPIFLEQIADEETFDIYDFSISNNIIDPGVIINQILQDINRAEKASVISAKFHNTVSKFTASMCNKISKDTGIKIVCLSGGVFQNLYLVNKLCEDLSLYELKPYLCRTFPTNDAGISFGQAVFLLGKI